MSEKSDGSGTITLGPNNPWSVPWGMWFAGANWPGMHQFAPPALELLDNARRVYEIIREAQRESKRSISSSPRPN